MTKLSWEPVLAFRLERQFLDARAAAGSLFEVTSALCGIRAQLPSTAELLVAFLGGTPELAVAA